MSQLGSFQRQNVAEQLAAELGDVIRSGRWPSGSQLPSFRQLAEEYSVSLRSVQMALQMLQEQNIVELRERQGAFVRPGRSLNEGRRIGWIWYSDQGNEQDATDQLLSLTSDNWGLYIQHACDLELHDHGMSVVTLPYISKQKDPVQDILRRIKRMEHDLVGVVIFYRPQIDLLLPALDKLQLPWVTINHSAWQGSYNHVTAANHEAAMRLGQCFMDSGISRILVLGIYGPGMTSSSEKAMGVYQAYLQAGLSTQQIVHVNCQGVEEQEACERVKAYLGSGQPRPQVIFCNGDLQAIGALRACRELGLSVPQDLAIVGSTGLMAAQFTHPSLTVINQPMAAMGREAASMLEEMVRLRIMRTVGRRVPAPITFRESFSVESAVAEREAASYQQEMASRQWVQPWADASTDEKSVAAAQ